jgi:hypothetical protein
MLTGPARELSSYPISKGVSPSTSYDENGRI